MIKEQKIKWFVGTVLVVLIVFGGAMILYQKDRYSKYYFDFNGYAIHRIPKSTGDIYSIEIFINNNPQPYLINSRYDPRELEKIDVEEGITNNILNKKELFVTMDSKATGTSVLAYTEIKKVITNPYLFGIPMSGALISPVGTNIVKTCDDVNEKEGIIYLKEGDKERVYSSKGCIILEALDEQGLVKVANRLMLDLLGVFK